MKKALEDFGKAFIENLKDLASISYGFLGESYTEDGFIKNITDIQKSLVEE